MDWHAPLASARYPDAQLCVRAERPSATLSGALVATLLGARSTRTLAVMREGPMLRFESIGFLAATYEDPETNPDMVAKSVADWLSSRLNERGIKTLGVFSEDFAWCVGVPTKPRELYVACSTAEGRPSSFEVTYFSIGGILSAIFGRKRTAENLKKLHQTVKESFASNPKITGLREEA